MLVVASLYLVLVSVRVTTGIDFSYCIALFWPRDTPVFAVRSPSPEGLTWPDIQSLCEATRPGFAVTKHFHPWDGNERAMCPTEMISPVNILKEDGVLKWNNYAGLERKELSGDTLTELKNPNVDVPGIWGALNWQNTEAELFLVGNETKFKCAVCQMYTRLNLVTQGVYPPHNNAIYAYDLELVSYDRIEDMNLVANGSDLTNRLLGDLAVAFNISVKSLRWHGATLNDEDGKAYVHVYYDPEDVNMDWFYYVRWNDRYLEHKTVKNFELKLISLNTECVSRKASLQNTVKEKYLSGYVDYNVTYESLDVDEHRVTTRECFWNAAAEHAEWSPSTTWGMEFVMCDRNSDTHKLVAVIGKADYGRQLRNFDLKLAIILGRLAHDISSSSAAYLDCDLSYVESSIFFHKLDTPPSAFAILANMLPLKLAKLLTFESEVKLVSQKNINLLISTGDSNNPIVGMALTISESSSYVEPIYRDNVTLPQNKAHIVVTVSDAIGLNADRLVIATFAAHLDLPNATAKYDVSSFDSWLSLVQVSFIRDEKNFATDMDFVDIAFKPVFHSPTLRGKCAERVFASDEWLGDNCRILKSPRDEMVVCRCKNIYNEGNMTSGMYLIYGFDASLSTYMANNKTLIIVIIVVSILSAFGLLSVIFTALLFKEWIKDQGHKIFLQMILALSVNLLLGFINNFVSIDTKSIACIAVGVLRHYSFLAMFFWMMILSGLQVRRLTTISGAKSTTHLILKVSLIAWGLPLIPIVILLAWDVGFYKSEVSNRGYCYPEDVAFQATVQGPAGVILIANLLIFGVILNHIYGWVKCNKDAVVRKTTTDDHSAQLRNLANSIFIFFLFGFTWLFHFLSEEGIINSEFLFEFMFLITASFHLFMLALFFIVLDRKTRTLWKKALGFESSKILSTPSLRY